MIGKMLGHYKVCEPLGRGGMGEVYLADDLNLNRKVALKFLPDAFTGDPERMARFEREAKLLATLNHPNIAAIYGLEEAEGKRFLVLELVEGETLAQRLSKGPLPIEEALEVCRQIADGLEAAHEKGVIHRDLKPGNVMITAEEKVKILDFGLAKALADETPSGDASQSPTLTDAMTQRGMILGTAAYMSPEQAKGKAVDKRADIWAFGCILYECLTGKRAFEGETVTETLAAILRGDPGWEVLPATTPSSIRMLLGRCLNKDPKHRTHDTADIRIELEEAIENPRELASATVKLSSRWSWSRVVPWLLVVLLVVAVVFISQYHLRNVSPTSENVIRFGIALPNDLKLFGSPVRSPNESCLALIAKEGSTSKLYIRFLKRSEAVPLEGTEGVGSLPFFSPDGKWIAFITERELKKVSLSGGSPQVLCQASFGCGTWGADGKIIYTPSYSSGLWRIPDSGGDPEKLTEPERSRGELGHWWPQLLPDGDTILFTNYSTPFDHCSIAVYSLKTKEQKVIVESAMFGRYLPTGHIIYARSEMLLAAPFDLQRLEVTGPAAQVLDDVAVDFPAAMARVSISENGMLAYIHASSAYHKSNLVHIDRKGNIKTITDVQQSYGTPKLSPDGHRIAVTVFESGRASDVWTYDLERGNFTRITFGTASEDNPIWTHDGSRIIFKSERPQYDLYWKAADGTGTEEPLVTSPFDKVADAVSSDGKILIYSEDNPETASDIWVLSMEGERKPEPWLRTSFNEYGSALSPDGNWLAYVSDESRRSEVYIQRFPDHGDRIQVSVEGGDMPLWAPNSRELFFRSGDRIMAVPLTLGEKLKSEKPTKLFDFDVSDERASTFDISSDGNWFIGVQRDPMTRPVEVEVVLNWFEELKQKAPAK